MQSQSMPGLLTRSEREWLLGNIQVSSDYERQMRSRIKRRLQTFQDKELPLLVEKGFTIMDITTNNNSDVTTRCHALVAKTARALPREGEKMHQLPSTEKENGALGGIWTHDLYLTKVTL